MKWINAEQQVTVTIYDEEHEEYLDRIMTVEEMLDTYTKDGCPTMYSNPARKGRWIQEWGVVDETTGNIGWRDSCSKCGNFGHKDMNYCPNCGAMMIKLK